MSEIFREREREGKENGSEIDAAMLRAQSNKICIDFTIIN